MMNFPYDGQSFREGDELDVHEKDVQILTIAARIRALEAEEPSAPVRTGGPERGRKYRRRDQAASE